MTLIRSSFLALLMAASPDDSFVVASLKLSANQNPVQGVAGMAPPIRSEPTAQLSFSHVTLQGMLCRAYPVRYSLITGPSWIDNTYYDLTAKVPPGADAQRITSMLRNLLVERFDMRVRWVTKHARGWSLVAGPSPLKLKRTSLSGEPSEFEPDGVPNRSASVRLDKGVKTVTMRGVSLQGIANAVSGELGDPVVDSTGVKGAFDFTLEGDMDPDDAKSFTSKMSPISVKKSLQKYGLDVVKGTVEVRTLVVDSASKKPKSN